MMRTFTQRFILPLLLLHVLPVFSQNNKHPNAKDSMRQHALNEFVVRDKLYQPSRDTLSSTLKLDIPLLQLPQNIISVSAALLQEQGVLELKDAARNASGVYFGLNNNVFDGSSNLYIRGFAQNAIFRNGLPAGDNRGAQNDEAITERIEFIKGPAGFLGSSGEPGGRINVVTKTPGTSKIRAANIQAGSFNFYRIALDISDPVKEKGFSFRFNAAYNNQDYYRDFMNRKKVIVAPVVQYNFSKNTSLLGEYILNSSRAKNAELRRVVPVEMMLKDEQSSNVNGDPGMPVSTTNEHTGRLVLTHQFNERWKITSQSSYKSNPSEIWTLTSNGNAVSFDSSGVAMRQSYRTATTAKVAATQLFVNGTFNTGTFIKHHLMAGGEYFYTRDSSYQIFGAKTFPFYQDHMQFGLNTDSLKMPAEKPYNYFNTKNNWVAAYLYNTIYVGKYVVVSLGARYTHNKREATTYYTPAVTELKQEAFTPRAGVTVLIDKRTAAYFLYDETFMPQSGQDRLGNLFEPLTGNDIEAGIKRNWLNGMLATSATVFEVKRNNMLAQDPEALNFSMQIGQVRSRGIELDVLGAITPQLAISANYALADIEVTKNTRTQKAGDRYGSAPREVINTWIRYSFPAGILPGFSINVSHTSIIKRGTTTKEVYLPDYTRFDAGMAYTRGKITARLFLENLTNKRYIATGDIYGGKGYYTEGAPLNFRVAVSARIY